MITDPPMPEPAGPAAAGAASLPRLRPATLILAGDDDPIIPLIKARIMHRLIPRSELNIYHGGHLELATDAERMAPIVEAFLTAERSPGRHSAITGIGAFS